MQNDVKTSTWCTIYLEHLILEVFPNPFTVIMDIKLFWSNLRRAHCHCHWSTINFKRSADMNFLFSTIYIPDFKVDCRMYFFSSIYFISDRILWLVYVIISYIIRFMKLFELGQRCHARNLSPYPSEAVVGFFRIRMYISGFLWILKGTFGISHFRSQYFVELTDKQLYLISRVRPLVLHSAVAFKFDLKFRFYSTTQAFI